jgi:glycosyltransferase involved in cell wall biosynthesis
LFINTISHIKDKGPKFVIVGDGQLRDELKTYSKELGVDNRVIFTGFRNDLEKIYADLDISVISSLNEGLPVAVIESMTAGIPVVSTDVGGVRELIDDGIQGFIVPPNDPVSLADRIEELIEDDKLRKEFGKAATRKVYPYHDYRRLIDDMEELYSAIVNGQPIGKLHMRKFTPNNTFFGEIDIKKSIGNGE